MKKKITSLTQEQLSVKSLSKLPAQNAILCEPGVSRESALYASIIAIINDNRIPFDIRLLIDLMLSGGLRVSEVISLRGIDVRLDGKLVVFQSKNNQYVVIRSINFNAFWLAYGRGNFFRFAVYSRFSIYRIFKKLGISAEFENMSKSSVCHLPRHLVGALVYQSTNSIEEVKKELSHKNQHSSKSYIKNVK